MSQLELHIRWILFCDLFEVQLFDSIESRGFSGMAGPYLDSKVFILVVC